MAFKRLLFPTILLAAPVIAILLPVSLPIGEPKINTVFAEGRCVTYEEITREENPRIFSGRPDAAYACVEPDGVLGPGKVYFFNEADETIAEVPREKLSVGPGKLTPTCKVSLSSGDLSGILSPICWGRTISVFVGTALIMTAAWLLAAAGYLFNILIDHTVVKFGSILLETGAQKAIEVGWTALRDIANIVIIAMFVFIAINIILGVKEFGEKRLVARVLIIAVLINFSLLFTKAIIDASNFTAYQFVKASGFVTDTADAQGIAEGEFVKKGIAGKFVKFMGLASLAETKQALSNAAFGSEKNQYATANGWFALLHGLVSATLLLFAAAVLLYACYLLITRAVLLIFLMMTSALAFASWLIPQQRIVKGFARWWEALLKAALFGPLLVIFLWASLNVAGAITTATEGKGTLGALLSSPEETLNLDALWSYVIVLGLLFASIYAANIFSQGIAGFAAAGNLVKGATFAGPAIAWRFTGAPFLRQTAGRFAYGRQFAFTGDAKYARTRAEQLRDEAKESRLKGKTFMAGVQEFRAKGYERQAARSIMTADQWGKLARTGFNIGSAGSIKTLGKMMGTPLLSSADRSGAAAQGFAQAIEQKIKRGDELAQKLAVSGAEKDKIRGDAERRVSRERATGEKIRLKDVHDAEGDYEQRAATPTKARDDARRELTKLAGENIRIEDAKIHSNKRIRDAALDLETAESTLAAIDRTRLDAARAELDKFNREVEKEAKEAAEKTIDAAQRGAAEAARRVGRKAAGILETPGMRAHIGDEVRAKFSSGVATSNLRSVLAGMIDAEVKKTAPPTPPASGAGTSGASGGTSTP